MTNSLQKSDGSGQREEKTYVGFTGRNGNHIGFSLNPGQHLSESDKRLARAITGIKAKTSPTSLVDVKSE